MNPFGFDRQNGNMQNGARIRTPRKMRVYRGELSAAGPGPCPLRHARLLVRRPHRRAAPALLIRQAPWVP